MSDPLERRLLVPMNIEAIVIGASPGTDWVNLKPDFRGIYLNQFLGQQLETDPFTTDSGLNDEPGVHLHWALPDGLAHGIAGRNGGDPEFPPIPNRWLVVRLWDRTQQDPGSDLQSRAWIVESDVVTGTEEGAIWLGLRAENPDPANAHDYSVRVGRRFELDRWPGETAAPGVDVTAMGYGDPSFAAYYPACREMLGFHDDDLADLKNVALTYFVAGWYSEPSKDPLHRAAAAKDFARLEDFLAQAKWVYPGYDDVAEKVQRARFAETNLREAREMAQRLAASRADAKDAQASLEKQIAELEIESPRLAAEVSVLLQDLPGRIVCHGVVSKIQWKAANTLYDSGVPRGGPFTVAAGNTAIEALAAVFQTKLDSGTAKLLEAFQYDLLTELERPGGDEKFERKTHERGFRPLSRGIRWELIDETPPAGGPAATSAPPIPGDIRALLENVNIRQRQINRLKRQRDSRKSELYATWYKSVLDADAPGLAARMTNLQREIDALTVEIAALEDEKEGRPSGAQWDALQASLRTLLPGYALQSLDEQRFWRPNDPVVLLAGDAFRRVYRHGENGRYRSDGSLLCRTSGQEFDGVKISILTAKIPEVDFGPADLDRWCDPLPQADGGPLPPDIRETLQSLFHEALLLTLDEKRALLVAVAAYEKNEPGLAKDQAQEVARLAVDLSKYLQSILDDAKRPEGVDSLRKSDDVDPPATGKRFRSDGILPSPIAVTEWQRNPWLPLFLQWQVSWTPAYADTAHALENWTLNGAGTGFDGKSGAAGNMQLYVGTTLLTPGAALHFSARLRQYNLAHDNPGLKAFQTAASSMSLLCQSLGGLTENLLTRKGRLELRPLDPGTDGRGPVPSPIFDWVQDIDWLSPLTDGEFFPVRAGHLTLEKLWIVDAFGQLLQLENEGDGKLKQPIVPPRLAGPNGAIRLEPRLAQPARLDIEWLPPTSKKGEATSAELRDDEEFNPVCGWIVPNLLDSGLMIYDARGNALGALQAVQRKSWDQGVGGKRGEIESFHWVDVPGSKDFFFGTPPSQITDPLGPGANPHLRDYVNGLLSLTGASGPAFGQLLGSMDDALSAGGGAGSSRNPGLALLIGRPLALVRATIRLELDGEPALAQGWSESAKDAKDRTGGIEQLKFPIRLGDRRRWNGTWLADDGLAGFFLDQDYSRFYPAYGLQGRADGLQGRADDAYSRYDRVPEISIAEPLDLTLLMDPGLGVCATTGILPRVVFNLPHGDVAETLENKQVVFFTGPLISTAAEIRMPRPSDLYGQWSWTHHPAVQAWREEAITDTTKEEGRFFEEPLRIAEGWLKLVTEPVAIRTFKVKGLEPVRAEQTGKAGEAALPAQFEVPSGAVVLSWAAIGADEIELKEGEISLFKSTRHPLPIQFLVQVKQSTSFTLIAAGKAENPAKAPKPTRKIETKTIEIRVAAEWFEPTPRDLGPRPRIEMAAV